MKLTQQHQKQIQALMSDIRWSAIEVALDQFMKENFVEESAKKDTEFNTLWYAAEKEGGVRYLQRFMGELEESANDVK